MVSISFLLGAGFSAPFDIPTMSPFLGSFCDLAKHKYPQLSDTLTKHLDKLGNEPDLESLLSSLGKAERVLDGLPQDIEINEEFNSWQKQSLYLKSHLISYIIERCERFDRNLATEILSPVMTRIYTDSSIQKIHLFTTNYDRIIEHVCDTLDIEFADGFIGSENELVAPWDPKFNCKICLYKLHGSVSYYVDKKESNRPTFLRLDRGYPLPGPEFRLSREGHDLEPLMVLPTLEKDALGDPYGHLNHMFTQTISDTMLVVAVGTSLRDNHLVSAINYNVDNIVVLVVDTDPTSVKKRIPNVSSVPLKANAREFFENSIERLIKLFKRCSQVTEKQSVFNIVEEFAIKENNELSQRLLITDQQNSALKCIQSSTHNQNYELLTALQQLRGIADSRIFHAVANNLV